MSVRDIDLPKLGDQEWKSLQNAMSNELEYYLERLPDQEEYAKDVGLSVAESVAVSLVSVVREVLGEIADRIVPVSHTE